ncbi:antibiotic biosynthesis monooxygenase family protein [Magnetococcales bacterium HHB-1]
MHVVISCFKIVNELHEEVLKAFINRPGMVDQVPGFIRMDVLQKHDDPDQFWLYTVWQDKESFEMWHKSHAYQQAHQDMPKGLKLDSEFTQIQHFKHICS